MAANSLADQLAELQQANARMIEEIAAREHAEAEVRRQKTLLENIVSSLPQGISVFDENLRLLVWNEGMREVLELPEELMYRGVAFADLVRVPAQRGDYGPGDPEELVRQRCELARAFQPHSFERAKRSGRTHLVVGKPFSIDDAIAGFITTYTDITASKEAENALRQSHQVLASILENFPGGVSVCDKDLRLIAHNSEFKRLLELPESLFATAGVRLPELIRFNAERGEYGAVDVEAKVREITALAQQPTAHRFERDRPDGRALEVRGAPLPDGGFVTIYIDISERRQRERELARLHERLSLAATAVGMGIWDWDTRSDTLYADRRVFEIFGVPVDAGGRFNEWARYIHEEDRARATEQVRRFLRSTASTDTITYRIVRPDGAIRHLEVHTHVTRDTTGRVVRAVGVDIDITEKKEVEARIQHLAHHDPLTGLPNRLTLELHLEQSIAQAQRNHRSVAVLFLDLDRFKAINDTLGHLIGDLLLIEVAQRLKNDLRVSDTVARLGGDEFVVVLAGLDAPEAATTVAAGILDALSRPFMLDGHRVSTTPSLGIALYPQDGADVRTIMKHADTAMYHAKAQGRNNFQYFDISMNRIAQERLEMEEQLREALRRGELVVHYQPRLDCRGTVVGLEALVRWESPRYGLRLPEQFLPVASESALIGDIDEWVLIRTCHQMHNWHSAGLPLLPVSINLSTRQLRDPDLLSRLATTLGNSGLPPRLLAFDLSESAAMERPESTLPLLGMLKQMGVGLSMDKFGTGYSSLTHLQRLPLDALKIDRSFIAGIAADAQALAIVRGTIAFAHNLGMRAVAVGVETAHQFDLLSAAGCDELQGNYFTPPLAAAAVPEFLAKTLAS